MIARLSLVLLAAVATAAQAQTTAEVETNNIVVTRDAETGQLRPATAEEMAAMSGAKVAGRARAASVRAASAATQTPQQKLHASGARGGRLTDDMVSYSVVVRNADGTLTEQCVGSKAEAEALVKAQPADARPARATE